MKACDIQIRDPFVFPDPKSNQISGPWRHIDAPVWGKDGGHGMVFKSFEGKTFLTFHVPNQRRLERPRFYEATQLSDGLILANVA